MKRTLSCIALSCLILGFAGCSMQPADVSLGGGTETIGITGSAADTAGSAVAGALVKLRRADFLDTAGDHLAKSGVFLADGVTDDTGGFLFRSVDTGAYIIEILGQTGSAVLPCTVTTDSFVVLPPITLKAYASIVGHVPGHIQFDSTRIRVYIYGMDHSASTDMHGDFSFDKIPAGTYAIRFVTVSSLYGEYDTADVHVDPGAWMNMGRIYLPQKPLAIFGPDSIAVRNILDSNRLFSIPVSRVATVDPMTRRVISLNLSWSRISRLTSHIGALTELSGLIIENDSLTTLPAECNQLKKLKTLNLRNNRIAQYPEVINALDSLRELCLAGNLLDSLATSIGNLTSLSKLDISYNQLAALPVEIGNCRSLTVLTAYNNRLSSIPEQLAGLGSLQYLLLQSNQISVLPEALVSWHPDMFLIGVDANRLCVITPSAEYWLDAYSLNDEWRFSQDCF